MKGARDEKHTPHRFQQMYDHLVMRIKRGEWQAHDKLPSVRLLAEEYQVHRLTAFRVCRMLTEHGITYVKEKVGYFIRPDNSSLEPAEHAQDRTGHANFFIRSDLSEIHQLPAKYQFSQALIDPNLLPNLFLSEYVKQVFDAYPKLMGTYSSVQGDEELREVLAHHLGKRHRLPLSGADLLMTTGATQAIDLLARLYIQPMDAVMVERPTYSGALDIFRSFRARILPVDIYPYGYDLETVERFMKRYHPRFFYVNPTFHNPTGYTVPSEMRKQLVELAEKYQCVMIEDDAFHDMYFEETPPAPLFTYDTEGWVVYLRSFSKYVSPGLRICAVVGRRQVMEPLRIVKSLADNGMPLVNQKIFLHYFQSDRLQNHLKKLRIALQIRREIMEEELAGSGWKWHTPKGGLNLWLELPDGLTAERLLQVSLRQSVSFVPGKICDPLREMPAFLRLSYSYGSEVELRDGMRILVQTANSLSS